MNRAERRWLAKAERTTERKAERRRTVPDLRYLKDEPIPVRKPMTLNRGGADIATPNIVDVMALLDEAYSPTREFTMLEKDHRLLNKAMDALGKPEDGFFVLDATEVGLVKRMVQEVATRISLMQGGKVFPFTAALARNVPDIVDWLDGALKERPDRLEHSDNGVVKAAEKVAQEA